MPGTDEIITRRIYTIGEVVYDIIFKDDHPVAARPGGSMLNSAISLGRSRLPVFFTGTCGDDPVGDLISAFLKKNRVDISYLHRERSQSIIAIALLDQDNNATYSFYKGMNPPEQPRLPVPQKGDILLFGSFYSISLPTRKAASGFRDIAAANGALVVYDPNFRPTHLRDLEEVRPYIEENIGSAGIVRGSNEDFEIIFGTATAESTWQLPCFRNCGALVYTNSSGGVDLCTRTLRKHYPVPALEPVSTIGAGDSFNAGIIASIYENSLDPALIDEWDTGVWDRIIEKGTGFAALVCMSYDNYIPDPAGDPG